MREPHGIDVARVRADTPACETLVHLNNAGAALPPAPVLERMQGHLELEARIGGYEAALECAGALEAVYGSVARLVGGRPDEIALVESATRAFDMAFYALPFARGDRILTTSAEYASNFIAFLQVARRTGARIEVIPDDEHGQASVHALEEMLDERVRLIAVTHVPTNGGLVNPAAEIGRVARAAGVPYLLDACQSVGQLPLDVGEIGCDMLSATGRKFLRAPRGTGFLWIRRELADRLEPPFLDLHAATWTAADSYAIRAGARRFEAWEYGAAARLGLGAAADYARALGLQPISERVAALAGALRAGLARLPGVTVRDRGRVRCGIVSFTVDGHDPDRLREELRAQRFNVWVSRLADTRLDMQVRGLERMLRASVHYYNTDEEIERFCAALAALSRAG